MHILVDLFADGGGTVIGGGGTKLEGGGTGFECGFFVRDIKFEVDILDCSLLRKIIISSALEISKGIRSIISPGNFDRRRAECAWELS